MAYVEQMDKGPDLLATMNACIVRNKAAGLYDGCKNAVELAQQLAAGAPAGAKAKATPSKSPKRAAASPARR